MGGRLDACGPFFVGIAAHDATRIPDNPGTVVPERGHDTRSTSRPELLALLHLVECAEKDLAGLMRSQHRWVGKVLRAATRRELEALKFERVRLCEEVALTTRQLRERTDDLVASVERTSADE